jgi:hypothetical protein
MAANSSTMKGPEGLTSKLQGSRCQAGAGNPIGRSVTVSKPVADSVESSSYALALEIAKLASRKVCLPDGGTYGQWSGD